MEIWTWQIPDYNDRRCAICWYVSKILILKSFSDSNFEDKWLSIHVCENPICIYGKAQLIIVNWTNSIRAYMLTTFFGTIQSTWGHWGTWWTMNDRFLPIENFRSYDVIQNGVREYMLNPVNLVLGIKSYIASCITTPRSCNISWTIFRN